MTLDFLTSDALFAQLPEPALLIASTGALVDANPLARVLFELPDSLADLSVVDLLPEPERRRLDPLAWFDRWSTTPDAPELQYVYLTCRTQSGAEKQLRVRVARVGDADAGGVHYLVVLHDVTAEQARTQEFKNAHRIAARVLAISSDAVVTVDRSFRILDVNAGAQSLFGYTRAELVGAPLAELLPDRFRVTHAGHMETFAAEPDASRLMGDRQAVVGRANSGEEIPLEASITKVTVDGDLVFSAHLRDLRPREAARREREASEARFRALFDHALQAMAVLEPDGRVVAINPAARDLLTESTTEADLTGASFANLPWWSDDPDATQRQLAGAIDACNEGQTYRTQGEIVDARGVRRRLDVSLRPVLRGDDVVSIIAEGRLLESVDG